MRTHLAFVAAICAFAALATASVDDEAFSRPVLLFLRPIENTLCAVTGRVEDTDRRVAEVMETTASGLQMKLGTARSEWNSTVAKYAAQAQDAGIDVSDCIDAMEQPFQEFFGKFQAKVESCLEEYKRGFESAFDSYRPLLIKAPALLEEAKIKGKKCDDDYDYGSGEVPNCATWKLAPLVLKAGAMYAEATFWYTWSGFKDGSSPTVDHCFRVLKEDNNKAGFEATRPAELCILEKLKPGKIPKTM